MTYTDNLNLKKPADNDNDYVDIQDLNDNMDTIDAAMAKKADLDDDDKVPASQLPDYADSVTLNGVTKAQEDGDVNLGYIFVEATDEDEAVSLSSSNPNVLYFWEES